LRAAAKALRLDSIRREALLAAFEEGFFDDPRAGFLLEDGSLRAVNAAASLLLDGGLSVNEVLKEIEACVTSGRTAWVRTSAGRFRVASYPAGGHDAGGPRVCFAESVATLAGFPLSLTPRQAAVLDGVAKGWSNETIALHFGTSAETVRRHVRHILLRTGARNRAQLLSYCLGASGRKLK